MDPFNFHVPHWNSGCYTDKKAPIKCARPFCLVHEIKRERAVLCCHGFTGFPGELAKIALDLYEAGFDVFVPRYSGHGTSKEDFLQSKASDWLGTADNAMRSLQQTYSSVYLVGHSMGGLIALILSARYGVKRMSLYAPALFLLPEDYSAEGLKALGLLGTLEPKPLNIQEGFEGICERDEGDTRYLEENYCSYNAYTQVYELLLLKEKAKSLVPSLFCDTLTMCGLCDETVDPFVAQYITEHGKGHNKALLIPQSGHLLPYEKNQAAQDEANNATVDWLSKTETRSCI